MIWNRVFYTEVVIFLFIYMRKNRIYYNRISAENLDSSLIKLSLSNNYIFLQENNLKHKFKYVINFL